jgi:hypothetical protein
MEPAIIIISSDNQFVVKSISRYIDESTYVLIERCLGPVDFEILINELIDENIRIFSIILDESTPMSEKIEIQNCLFKYENQIHYNFVYGLDLVDDFVE